MNRVIRWNDIERESLPRLLSQVRVHSEKNFNTRAVSLVHASSTPRTRVRYPSYTRALPLEHWCTTPRTRVFEDRECDVALNLYRKSSFTLRLAFSAFSLPATATIPSSRYNRARKPWLCQYYTSGRSNL